VLAPLELALGTVDDEFEQGGEKRFSKLEFQTLPPGMCRSQRVEVETKME